MKFSHIADCHIGGWRDPKLKELNTLAFFRAIEISIKENVDFVLIAGDLFNTALPGIDKLKDVVKKFKELHVKNIPVYLIPGSHDFSPSGKTMLDVLEEAGLCVNVVKGETINGKLKLKFTIDKKTGAKITGMLGRRGMLERSYYEDLDRTNLENETGFKIFLFHTSITELKPEKMDKMESSPISLLPKNFDYYAGGHVHIVEKINLPGYKNVVYPGPLFPNSFSELEELKGGGFYIYDNGELIRHDTTIKNIITLNVDCNNKNPQSITANILIELEKNELNDKIILFRLHGQIESGKLSEIDYRQIYDFCYNKNAYFVMRNTAKLKTKEYDEVKIEAKSSNDVESELISEHIGQIKVDNWDIDTEKSMINSLMTILSQEKNDGEKVYEFEERIKNELKDILEI
jgi:DNA repair protein SbcD/Mre11